MFIRNRLIYRQAKIVEYQDKKFGITKPYPFMAQVCILILDYLYQMMKIKVWKYLNFITQQFESKKIVLSLYKNKIFII